MKFLHAMIKTKNIKNTMKFYQDFLGFHTKQIIEMEDKTLYWLENNESGDTIIEITEYKNPIIFKNNENQTFGHLAFGTKNLEQTEKKMQEFGYSWTIEPFYAKEANIKVGFLKDTDDNEIELIELS